MLKSGYALAMEYGDLRALIRLDGQRAVITGAGSGIGRATAVQLSAAGASLLIVDRNVGAIEQAAEEIRASGGTVDAAQVDVTDYQAVERVVGGYAAYGLSVLVNAAGIVLRKDLLATTPDEWAHVIDVNLTGYFNVLRIALPALERSHNGRVVQIASISAHIGNGYPAYTASKGAVASMTRQLASELGPRGIRINSISPALIETPINRDTLGQQANRDIAVGSTPLGRLGSPFEIANVALFLVSQLSSFVSGIDIVVDGGLTAGLHWGSADSVLSDR